MAAQQSPPPPRDVLRQLLYRETTPDYSIQPNYIEAVQRHGMDRAWRWAIAWYFEELSEYLDLPPEVPSAALNFLDRYLGKRSCNHVLFQLASLTALHISAKLHGKGRQFNVRLVIQSGNNQFRTSDVFAMERDMLRSLSWSLNPPTPLLCLDYFTMVLSGSATPLDATAVQAAKQYLLVAAAEVDMLAFTASQLAWAAILLVAPGTDNCVGDVGFNPDEERVAFCQKRLKYIMQRNTNEVDEEVASAATCQWVAKGGLQPRVARSPESVLDVDRATDVKPVRVVAKLANRKGIVRRRIEQSSADSSLPPASAAADASSSSAAAAPFLLEEQEPSAKRNKLCAPDTSTPNSALDIGAVAQALV